MKKTCIIGTGRWATRLQKRLPSYNITNIDLIDSMQDSIDVSKYNKVIICIPAYCTGEVLQKIQWGNGRKTVISCVKGLMNDGSMVCRFLNEHLQKHIIAPVHFLGGANIDNEKEIVEITDDEKLELACVLKNVYAIGFGMALHQGENYAAHELLKYMHECEKLGIKHEYLADLLVSCYSDKSRNKMFGKTFARGEKYNERTVEGLNTAQKIEEHDLFKNCKELRKITKKIC